MPASETDVIALEQMLARVRSRKRTMSQREAVPIASRAVAEFLAPSPPAGEASGPATTESAAFDTAAMDAAAMDAAAMDPGTRESAVADLSPPVAIESSQDADIDEAPTPRSLDRVAAADGEVMQVVGTVGGKVSFAALLDEALSLRL
jgi:hypothetical protein